jgi:hypothetical protein
LLFCPACNGLQQLEVFCPKCQDYAADYGRITDYLGPYSPYRSIEDGSMMEVLPLTCEHILNCNGCNYEFTIEVTKWPGSTNINEI